MTGPVWLGTLIGGVVLFAGVGALVRLMLAWRSHRPTDAEVDVHNVLMGVSMAGVLIPQLLIATGSAATVVWLVVWVVVTLWFAVSVARDAARGGRERRFTGHHVPHLVMSAAMVYMFAVGGGRMLVAIGGIVPIAALAYVFVVFMVGYAVVVVDRLPVVAVAGLGEARVPGRPATSASAGPPAADRTPAGRRDQRAHGPRDGLHAGAALRLSGHPGAAVAPRGGRARDRRRFSRPHAFLASARVSRDRTRFSRAHASVRVRSQTASAVAARGWASAVGARCRATRRGRRGGCGRRAG